MLDDIIEIEIDIAGDILEAVLSSKRKKSSPRKKKKATAQAEDPWTRKDTKPPWET